MTEISEAHKRQSKRTAAAAVAVVAVLSLAFIGLVSFLDNAAGQVQTDSVSIEAVSSSEPFYTLLIGSDSRKGTALYTGKKTDHAQVDQHADVMTLVRVDPETYNLGGAAASIKAVSSVTGTPINHYAEVHFSEFQELVDKVGGITVDVPVEISYKDALTGEAVSLQPGVQTLNGQQAQIFARARHEYGDNQEAKRQSNIRQILTAIVEKVLQKPAMELPGAILDLAQSVGTDMNTPDIVSLALSFSGDPGGMTLYSCTGPSNGDFDEAQNGLWLCYENPEGWATLMAAVDAGEDPGELDVESTAIIPASSDASV